MIKFPTYNQYHAQDVDPGLNGNIWNVLDVDGGIFRPEIKLPSLGNTHTHRRGNRITVTSIRLKLHLRLPPRWCYAFQPNTSPVTDTFEPDIRMASTNKRFFKFRFMVVQFNDDTVVTDNLIATWFFRTYCYFKNDTRLDVQQPAVVCTEPISVHSNILRLTTNYTGKFNILMDKPITITSRSPLQTFDITIPLNRSYVFDEIDADKLLFPNIHLFILPPLNWEADMDPLSAYELMSYFNSATSTQPTYNFNLINIDYFAKLNFVDL